MAKTPTKTPTKTLEADHSFQLPDTPTSLASSYNKEIEFEEDEKRKKMNLVISGNEINGNDESIINDNFTKLQYNPLHDSIESFVDDRISMNDHNSSIIQDFQDIKSMIDAKKNNNDNETKLNETKLNENNEENESDLIKKWLQDRKRWDMIQQTYEQKVINMENKLKNKTLYFNKKIDSHLKQEMEYQKEIKNLNHQIQTFHSKQNEQCNKLEKEHQELSENHRELNTKYQDLQQLIHEKENLIQNLQKELNEKNQILVKLENDNNHLSEKINALNIGFDNDIKLKTKGLNEELIKTTKQLNECKQENERLKQLELTSQNMVERLLKRLEQQIHSAENIQQQLNIKQKQHDQEILRLEQINCKLQNHLTIFNKNNNNNNKTSTSPLSKSSSNSSLFTLSTVMTTTGDRQKSSMTQLKDIDILKKDLQAMNKENQSLKQTVKTFREMLDVDKANNKQHDQEWIKQTKQMAKQTVLIEKLKNDINNKDNKLNQNEIIIDQQKEKINNFELNIKQQRNSMISLEKTNSDISMELIQERSLRQKLEKEIEDLQFENKQLRNKLIAFKNFASQTDIEHFEHSNHSNHSNKNNNNDNENYNHKFEQSTDDDVFDNILQEPVVGRMSDPTPHKSNVINSVRPSSANVINDIHKDQLLLDGLRHLINRYSNHFSDDIHDNAAHSVPNIVNIESTKSVKSKKKQHRFNTSRNLIHKTINSPNAMGSNRKLPKNRHRISSMTPASYLHGQPNDNNNNIKIKKRRKSSNFRRRSTSLSNAQQHASLYKERTNWQSNSRKINKSKSSKMASSTKPKSKTVVRNKRKKTSSSASKQHVLKPCIHNKHWV